MFYLNKLGNLLDTIDGGSGDKDGQAPEQPQPEEQGSLASSLGGLLTSASQAAGSVASNSTTAAKAHFDAISSLLREDDEDTDEQASRKAATEQPLPDELPEASPAPSASDLVAQGWNFEDTAEMPRPSNVVDERPEAVDEVPGTSSTSTDISHPKVRLDHPSTLRSLSESGATLTTQGSLATSEEYHRVEDPLAEVLPVQEVQEAAAFDLVEVGNLDPSAQVGQPEVVPSPLETIQQPLAMEDPQLLPAAEMLPPEHSNGHGVEAAVEMPPEQNGHSTEAPEFSETFAWPEPSAAANGGPGPAGPEDLAEVQRFDEPFSWPEPETAVSSEMPDSGGVQDLLEAEPATSSQLLTPAEANGHGLPEASAAPQEPAEEPPELRRGPDPNEANGHGLPEEAAPALPTPMEEPTELRRGPDPNQVVQLREEYEARLMGAVQQITHLQARIEELESEAVTAKEVELKLAEKLGGMTMQLAEAQAARQQAEAMSVQLQREAEQLRQEAAAASERARVRAAEESESALGQVREEMERELEKLLKQKDEQLRGVESKLASSERSRQSALRDLESLTQESGALKEELAKLRSDSAGRTSDHERSVEQLTSEYQKQIAELEERRDIEERQKHELALNLRSVEERSRSELAQLEAQKTQLELQSGALQVQLQEEQQKCVDLSVSLGEAQQRLAHAEENQGASSEEAIRAAEAKVRELSERAHGAEEKLLEAQSMRDMFAKETDMYRSELKVTRDEKTALEEELKKSQERLRELSASARQGAGQEAVLEAVQKDFESRMDRYRDEVQYLRQKCDEKEKRCEQLMAEKGALSVELKSASWGTEAVPSAVEDIEAGTAKTSAAAKAPAARLMRSLPLASPAWLRSADEPLKLVLRTLNTVPAARLTFFTYVILLHAWVLFILQQMALHPSSS